MMTCGGTESGSPVCWVCSIDERERGRSMDSTALPTPHGGKEVCMADDKPKPDFSNVQSGGSSTAPSAPSAPAPAPAAPRTYTVVAGDNLSKIAKRFYGDANQWKRIFEANRDIVKNPDLIHPGQTLKIPDK
jgi:nucleoid-associated protein YgaU